MKMKKRLGVAAVAALVLAAGTVTAFAEGTGPHARDGRGLGRLGESLDLSDEQQATWKSLHEQHQAEMEPLRQEGRDLRMRLRTAMEAESPDPAAVAAAALALKQHREKVRASREEFQNRLAGVLNDQQKAKFDAIRAARRGGSGRWGGFKAKTRPVPES